MCWSGREPACQSFLWVTDPHCIQGPTKMQNCHTDAVTDCWRALTCQVSLTHRPFDMQQSRYRNMCVNFHIKHRNKHADGGLLISCSPVETVNMWILSEDAALKLKEIWRINKQTNGGKKEAIYAAETWKDLWLSRLPCSWWMEW